MTIRRITILVIGLLSLSGCAYDIGYIRDAHDIYFYNCAQSFQLTSELADEAFTWSPDGRKIAYTRMIRQNGKEVGSGLWVYDLTAGTHTLAANETMAVHFYFDWSPNSRSIVFAGDTCQFCNAKLYRVNTDGSGLTRLTLETGNARHPDWSPLADRICYVDHRAATAGDIYWMNSDGTAHTRLTHTSADDQHPIWSPEADQIAFIRVHNLSPGDFDLMVIGPNGGEPRVLVDGFEYISYASWSPDGRKLLFHGNRADGERFAVYTINANGSALANLSAQPDAVYSEIEDMFPSWSPDGKQIAFVRSARYDHNGKTHAIQNVLFQMRADGAGKERLTNEQFISDTQYRPGPKSACLGYSY